MILSPSSKFGALARSAALAVVVLAGCGGGAEPASPDASSSSPDARDIDAPAPPIDAALDAPMARNVRCGDLAPAGAAMPAPLPIYSGGTCPTLIPGVNTIRSSGRDRRFILVVPQQGGLEVPRPLMVMWHWLGASGNSVLTRGKVQEAADHMHFIAAIPEKSPDLVITIPFVGSFDPAWPYLTLTSDARAEQEAVFFDDMLACVAAQHPVDRSRVSTFGVSAGALWSSQLLQRRSNRLASAIILSGGVGPATGVAQVEIKGFTSPAHKVPTLVAWGGATDQCGANFDTSAANLENGLRAGGHLIMECEHNCGHAEPPIDDAMGLQVLYNFAVDHPYWLDPGESPYQVRGLPAGTPSWCALGAGNATPRTGACTGGGFNIDSCPVPALP